MGEDLDAFFGIVTRSVARHAAMALATGGAGNIFTLVGDFFDVLDVLDVTDAADAMAGTDSSPASSGDEVRFGGIRADDGCLVNQQTGVGTNSVSDWVSGNKLGGIHDDHNYDPKPQEPEPPKPEPPKPEPPKPEPSETQK